MLLELSQYLKIELSYLSYDLLDNFENYKIVP